MEGKSSAVLTRGVGANQIPVSRVGDVDHLSHIGLDAENTAPEDRVDVTCGPHVRDGFDRIKGNEHYGGLPTGVHAAAWVALSMGVMFHPSPFAPPQPVALGKLGGWDPSAHGGLLKALFATLKNQPAEFGWQGESPHPPGTPSGKTITFRTGLKYDWR
jgi:hypothetical protein